MTSKRMIHVRLDADIHRQCRLYGASIGCSLQVLAEQALREKLLRDKTVQPLSVEELGRIQQTLQDIVDTPGVSSDSKARISRTLALFVECDQRRARLARRLELDKELETDEVSARGVR